MTSAADQSRRKNKGPGLKDYFSAIWDVCGDALTTTSLGCALLSVILLPFSFASHAPPFMFWVGTTALALGIPFILALIMAALMGIKNIWIAIRDKAEAAAKEK